MQIRSHIAVIVLCFLAAFVSVCRAAGQPDGIIVYAPAIPAGLKVSSASVNSSGTLTANQIFATTATFSRLRVSSGTINRLFSTTATIHDLTVVNIRGTSATFTNLTTTGTITTSTAVSHKLLPGAHTTILPDSFYNGSQTETIDPSLTVNYNPWTGQHTFTPSSGTNPGITMNTNAGATAGIKINTTGTPLGLWSNGGATAIEADASSGGTGIFATTFGAGGRAMYASAAPGGTGIYSNVDTGDSFNGNNVGVNNFRVSSTGKLITSTTLQMKGGSPVVGYRLTATDTLGNSTWSPDFSTTTALDTRYLTRATNQTTGNSGNKTLTGNWIFTPGSGIGVQVNTVTSGIGLKVTSPSGTAEGIFSTGGATALEADPSTGGIGVFSAVSGSGGKGFYFNGTGLAAGVVSSVDTGDSFIGQNSGTPNARITSTGKIITSDTIQLQGLTASRPLKLDASKNATASQINLASTNDVSGLLPYANFSNGAGLSLVGRSTNSSGVNADIVSSAGSSVLVSNPGNTSIGFGSIDLDALNTVGTSILRTTNGGTGLASYVQGDMLYYVSGSTLTRLPKDTNATRYISNQGTSNAPSWNQVNLANGVTGLLPYANFSNGNGNSVVGRAANSSGVQADINATINNTILRLNGTTLGFGSIDLSSTFAVGATILSPTNGGMGLGSAPTTGDIPYGSASIYSLLADVAAGSYLRSGGVSTAPLWSTLKLPNSVTSGSVVIGAGTNLYGEDNANFYYQHKQLGVGTTVPNPAGFANTVATITAQGATGDHFGVLGAVNQNAATDSILGILRFSNLNNTAGEVGLSEVAGLRGGASNSAYLNFYTDNAGSLAVAMTLDVNQNALVTGFIQSGGFTRVSTQFDKTNDSTLANVTGLTVNVIAGKTYKFTTHLFITAAAVGGHKYAIGGTCTATAIRYEIRSINNTSNAFVITSQQTALAGSAGAAGGTSEDTAIEGVITVNAAGTLTVQFAQNVATPVTTSSVLVGSDFQVFQVN